MTDRELVQQALNLLDDINQCSLPPTGIPLPAEIDHVMEALRARLAQPEPEPVAWRFKIGKNNDYLVSTKKPGIVYSDGNGGTRVDNGEPLYPAAPHREWQGLTEDDALQLLPVMPYEYDVDVEMILKFAEAIETKLKENNNG